MLTPCNQNHHKSLLFPLSYFMKKLGGSLGCPKSRCPIVPPDQLTGILLKYPASGLSKMCGPLHSKAN